MKRIFRIIPSFVLLFIFSYLSIRTLPDYGVNWDTLQHYVRGKIYFHFLTTGEKSFSQGMTQQEGPGSFYEGTFLDFNWTEKMTIGHPPLNDILMAASNEVLYKKLGLVSDISSFSVWTIGTVIFLVALLGWWSFTEFGVIGSVTTILTLSSYPLLFGEQHFNMKDPSVAAYFGGFIFFLYMGIVRRKFLWFIPSAIFFGLSIGTKFNILLSLPIIAIWVIFQYFSQFGSIDVKKGIGKILKPLWFYIWAAFTILAIGLLLFIVSFPAIWGNPMNGLLSVISYYQNIGGVRCFDPPFTLHWLTRCSDVHTLRLLVTTVPIPTLFLTLVGFIFGWIRMKKPVILLASLLFLSIIGRATLPFTQLYGGGLRQIMEFIVPMSLLAGFGAVVVWEFLAKLMKDVKFVKTGKCLFIIFIIMSFLPVVLYLIHIHPNENLYYNEFIGGLSGAVKSNYPVPANTYGNGYKQAINWINTNVETGAEVYLATGITSAVPSTYFRSDIRYKGSSPFIKNLDNSYVMELANPGMDVSMFYNSRFLKQFNPIHEVIVDTIPIVSVWKLNKNYIKVKRQSEKIHPSYVVDYEGGFLLGFNKPYDFSGISFIAGEADCRTMFLNSYSLYSQDGKYFHRLYEPTGAFINEPDEKSPTMLMAERAQFILFIPFIKGTCNSKDLQFEGVEGIESPTGSLGETPLK